MAGAARILLDREHGGTRPAVSLRLVLLAALAFAGAAATADSAAPGPARRTVLTRLVRQDCGSCHGMTLKGGLGPALTPEALRDKATESLVATILSGRPGTPMPPWRDFLSDTEAAWIVEQLQNGLLHAR